MPCRGRCVQAPIMIGCDLSLPLCKSALPLFLNKEMLAISQDDLGMQVRQSRLLIQAHIKSLQQTVFKDIVHCFGGFVYFMSAI